jgi:hypothetical protein
MFPRARLDQLTVRDLPDETLVFDHDRNKAHCLNREAALVWRHCDGQTDLAGLAGVLRDQLGVPDAEAVAQLALEQLSGRHLLEEAIAPLAGPARLSRRDALRRLCAAAVAMPVVMTLTAPNARAQISGMPPFPKVNLPPGAVTSCSGIANGTPCGTDSFVGRCCRSECFPEFIFQTDPNNCGSCGNVCPEGQICIGGRCLGQA